MELFQMINSKRDLCLTCEEIAKGSGVPISTVRKVFSKQTKVPRRQTLDDLSKFFESKYHPAQVEYFRNEAMQYAKQNRPSGNGLLVREPGAYMKSADVSGMSVKSIDKKYTLEDFDEMPMEPRIELIDGKVVTMDAPSFSHQDAVMEIIFQTKLFIKKNKGKCKAMVSPAAVQPVVDDPSNVVEPDVFVVCDEKKMEDGRHVIGAPDWIVEVLSPSTRNRDMVKKRDLYKKAGVREYWMVDMDGEVVIIYEFSKTNNPSIRTMSEPIPVGIYDGKLEIDLSELVKNEDA